MKTLPQRDTQAASLTGTQSGAAVERRPVPHAVVKSGLFLAYGVLFGIIMTQSEAISWYRIQEMFRFQSFHMYGIIGSTVAILAPAFWLLRKRHVRDLFGDKIHLHNKERRVTRYLAGGALFGVGWAITGACPGPLYMLAGQGYGLYAVALVSAALGTFVYGLVRERLPH